MLAWRNSSTRRGCDTSTRAVTKTNGHGSIAEFVVCRVSTHVLHRPFQIVETVVYCGSLVRAQLQASKSVSRVCIVFHVSAPPCARLSVSRVCIMSFIAAHAMFLAQVCKHRLASVLPTPLTLLARKGAITSFSIGAVGNCLVVLLVGTLSSPHACLLTPSQWFQRVKARHVLRKESAVAGR